MTVERQKNRARVYLVGAGPGRADLITVRGAELLKSADCIICDRLANPVLLKFARPDAEIINVPKREGTGLFTQEEINKLLIEKASSRQNIVRLKGGDPCIFARGAEEAEVLSDAGIDFEIVPGITAAVAAAGYTGIMLTHRDYSSQVVFVTGHEAEGKKDTNIDWRLLAEFPGTISFYMAMGTLEFIADQLIKNGMDEAAPAAVIANATLPNQRIAKAPLRLIAEKCKKDGLEPPAIVVIGEAAAGDTRLSWFMKKPLFGKSIVVTRDRRGNADFAARIIRQGGNPIEFEAIEIKPLTQTNKFLKTLSRFPDYDWIIFTSANGVNIFFDCLQNLAKDARVFASAKIAAIGSQTANRLTEFGIRPDFVPAVFTGKELGSQLIGHTNLKGEKVLLLRSQLASNELIDIMQQAGAEVDNVPIYTAVTAKNDCAWLTEKISGGAIDWLTFTSPSCVRAFFDQILPDIVNSSNAKVASLGPVTSEHLEELGVRINVIAKEHTIDGLLKEIEDSERAKNIS
ncbi:MAG TPA: uroporphyrinogen-III C-methyltransferase [Planctomycetes bacterium]|nr:uroporphyrinogen-III C-methyltransferase [Planctomycetota bacterium]